MYDGRCKMEVGEIISQKQNEETMKQIMTIILAAMLLAACGNKEKQLQERAARDVVKVKRTEKKKSKQKYSLDDIGGAEDG